MNAENCFVFVRVEYCTCWHRLWIGRALLAFDLDKMAVFDMDCKIDAMVESDLRQRGIILQEIATVKVQIIFVGTDDDILSLATDGVSEVTPGLRMFWDEVKPVSDDIEAALSDSII